MMRSYLNGSPFGRRRGPGDSSGDGEAASVQFTGSPPALLKMLLSDCSHVLTSCGMSTRSFLPRAKRSHSMGTSGARVIPPHPGCSKAASHLQLQRFYAQLAPPVGLHHFWAVRGPAFIRLSPTGQTGKEQIKAHTNLLPVREVQEQGSDHTPKSSQGWLCGADREEEGAGRRACVLIGSPCKGSGAGGAGFLPGICTEQTARKAGWGRVWVGEVVCSRSQRHSVMTPGSSVRMRKQARGLESPEGLKEAENKQTKKQQHSISQTIPGLRKRHVIENAYFHIETVSFI